MTDYEAHKLVMETPQRLKRVAELERQLAEAEAEIAKLKGDIQCMIEKAASKHLPAYREMGEQLAAKDAEIERLTAALVSILYAIHAK